MRWVFSCAPFVPGIVWIIFCHRCKVPRAGSVPNKILFTNQRHVGATQFNNMQTCRNNTNLEEAVRCLTRVGKIKAISLCLWIQRRSIKLNRFQYNWMNCNNSQWKFNWIHVTNMSIVMICYQIAYSTILWPLTSKLTKGGLSREIYQTCSFWDQRL